MQNPMMNGAGWNGYDRTLNTPAITEQYLLGKAVTPSATANQYHNLPYKLNLANSSQSTFSTKGKQDVVAAKTTTIAIPTITPTIAQTIVTSYIPIIAIILVFILITWFAAMKRR